MPLVDLIAVLALLQFFAFGYLVARARGKYGVHAPAVSGHEMFERTYRVQMNTLEQLVMFLPALYLAGKYWVPAYVAVAGAAYLVGRTLYAMAYLSDPKTRGLGFALTAGPTSILLVAGLVGAVKAMLR